MAAPNPRQLGIVFDIDRLADPMYGYAAYMLLFKAVMSGDRQLLASTRLWDGDTHATLAGTKREYVIAIESRDVAARDRIRRLVSRLEHPGLRPVDERFIVEDALKAEPLVMAARINELCVMDLCETSFVRNAWDAAAKAVQPASGLQMGIDERDAGAQRKPA